MIKVSIISVGKIKEKYWRDAIDEYIKRLQPYAKIKLLDIKEESFKDSNDRINILAKEAERINNIIPKPAVLISLDRVGVDYTSTDWSEKLAEWSRFGNEIVFIIGGPLGLSAEILSKSKELLSISKMTFTHQMTKVILLEQIYRGIMIQNGKTYHY